MATLHPVSPMRFWVQKILPLVYDDSLSYYELLNKVVAKVNEVIGYVDDDLSAQVEQILKEYFADIVYRSETECIAFNVKRGDE